MVQAETGLPQLNTSNEMLREAGAEGAGAVVAQPASKATLNNALLTSFPSCLRLDRRSASV